MRRAEQDRGSATVLVAISIGTLAAVLVVVLQIAGAVIARHRAETAADLAALAAAAAVVWDAGSACARAGSVASANGARMSSCEILGWDVRVTVEVDVRLGLLGGLAGGRARAGVW